MFRLLILGGTAEARELAAVLDGAGVAVVSSLAGRVAAPRLPAGAVRIGGFGGPDGLTAWLAQERIDAVVDATHPFAATISRSAATACARRATPLLALRRPGWAAQPGDDWHWAESLDAAAAMVPALGRRALLTTGRQELAAFAAVGDVWFLVRSIEPPAPPLPPHHEVLLERGPFTPAGERALLERHAIDVVVTKDSGGPAAAKLQAARERAIPVLIVRRPPPPAAVPAVGSVAAAARWALERRVTP